jgi:Tfp pilus assembly protein PilX
MQKLTRYKKIVRISSDQRGSALIIATVMSLILSLAGVGYLMVVRSVSINETAAMEQDKAFLAAESGLLYATRYARTLGTYFLKQTGSAPAPITVNGYAVTMSISSNVATQHNTIMATVSNPTYHFKKTVSWKCNSSYSTFSQLYGGYSANASTGWWTTNNFVGRFHMNNCLRLMNPVSNFYSFSGGLVTTSCSDAVANAFGNQNYTSNWKGFNPGLDLPANVNGDVNDFDRGVQIYNAGAAFYPDAAGSGHSLLNGWFKDAYLSDQEPISLPTNTNNDVLTGSYTTLVLSSAPTTGTPEFRTIGPDSGNYRPTLVYRGDGTADYYYFDGTNYTLKNIPYDGKILYARQDINVLGKVQGRTTLVTADNKSPVIVADDGMPGLIYNSYNYMTKTIPSTDTSVIGIISGSNICINNKWMKQWSGTAAGSGTRISMQDKLAAAEGITSDKYNSVLHVNAVLMATEYDTSGVRVGGMLLAADNKPLTVGIPNTSYFCLHVTGTSACRSYRAHAKDSRGTYQNTYVSDLRLAHNVTFPNQPLLYDAAGLLVLAMFNWTETTTQSM